MLSIVILSKQSWIKKDCFWRLFLNLHRLRKLNTPFHITVADNSSRWIRWLIYLISKLYSADYIHIYTQSKYYSPSTIRNRAAEYVFDKKQADYVFFVDIDVFFNKDALLALSKQIENRTQFFWFPVGFLKKTYNNKMMLNVCIKGEELDINNRDTLQIGYVTGMQFISKKLFYTSGGYNEKLIGYGGEDIEFLHRATLLAGYRKPIDTTDNYYLDDRGYNLNELKGFRNFYYKLYRSLFKDETLLYHFYHKRKNKSNYLLNRKKNDILMLKLMKDFDKEYGKL